MPRRKQRETVWAASLVNVYHYLFKRECEAPHQSIEQRDLYLSRCLLGIVNEAILGHVSDEQVRGYARAMGYQYRNNVVDFKSRAAGERDE
jgi:hypothetical protein